MGRLTGRPSRAVLFDMDDTIFDHSLTCREAIRRVRRDTPFLARRPLRELWTDYLTMLNLPPENRASVTSQQLREERWRRLAASCGVALDRGEARAVSQRYREYYQGARRPVPGAVELVRTVHRTHAVAIVTNNEVAEQEEKLDFLGLRDAVDAMVISQAIGASKPDPRIFREALRRLRTPPTAAVMVGDSWANDVLGAESAGICAVWFNRFGLPRPDPRPAGEIRTFEPPHAAAKSLLGRSRTARAPRAAARAHS